MHRVRRQLADGRVSVHWYAWRNGPSILAVSAHPTVIDREVARQEAAAARRYHDATESRDRPSMALLSGLIAAYLASPEFAALSDRTRKDRRLQLGVVKDGLGATLLSVLGHKSAKGALLGWRDQYARTPRTADSYLEALSACLSWGRSRGLTDAEPLREWTRLYKTDRSEVIWLPAEIEAVCAHAGADLARAIRLAAATGLRQGDLLRLTWADVHEDDIVRETRKRKRVVRIPLTAAAVAAMGERGDPTALVLTRAGQPWKVPTLDKQFTAARALAGIKGKRWHDFRGTYATTLLRADVHPSIVDQIMGWAPGSSDKIRARYVGSKALSSSVVEKLKRFTADQEALDSNGGD